MCAKIYFTKGIDGDKERYSYNKYGSVYVDRKKIEQLKNDGPVIYVGGQMEAIFHTIESKSGKTGDKNHNLFDGSWMYDYPTKTTCAEKIAVNGINFAHSLVKDLEDARLENVTLLTGSYGGIIGAYATHSPLVSKVIAVHPPFLGTPLANPKYAENQKVNYNLLQKLILKFLSGHNKYEYGFEYENFNGINLNMVDLNKLLVVGSAIDLDSKNNRLILQLYDIIKKITDKENDGVVIFDKKRYDELGIDCIETEEKVSHFKYPEPEYMQKSLSLGRKRR